MALTKPPVLPAWAESGDKVQPSNAEIQTGWPLSNTPPARQRWNWLLNFLANGVRYLTRRGVPDYGADETYMIGDRVVGDDGKTYRSTQDNNTGNLPSTSPLWWERWGFTKSELTAELNNHDYKDSCRVATTANLAALSGLLTIDGVVLFAGDRVLVKDQVTGSQNGIYLAAIGAWSRAPDFDENTEVTPGAVVPVEAGSAQGDTLWRLTTDAPITIGVTSLVFEDTVSRGSTPPQFDNDTSLATTAFVQRAMGNMQKVVAVTGNTTLASGDVGSLVQATGAGGWAVTLPTTVGAAARAFAFYNNAAAALTIAAASGQNINIGLANVASFSLPPGGTAWLITDGASWEVIAGSVLSVGGNQTWQNVLGSRSVGTTYTNTTGRPITVYASGGAGSAVNNYWNGVINGVPMFTSSQSSNANGIMSLGPFVVPPGATYAITQGAGTTPAALWSELR